ncbi:MAG: hypothetical protein ACE5NW_06300 [Acidiferrobacterales bacterium]
MKQYSKASRSKPRHMSCSRPLLLVLLLLPFFLATSACVSNRMYRPDNIQQESDYTLAFIELDDQGELWSAAQISRTVDLIERANQNKDASIVIVFIHGWNNNASPKQEQKEKKSLAGFKQFLAKAVEDARSMRPGYSPSVVGVFVAWRGQTVHAPLDTLTFYNRRRAASRISTKPSMAEALTRIIAATKKKPTSKTLLIGHSFGGLIMESALSQVFVRDIVLQRAGRFDLPVDLVVLINPASPAINAKQLVDVLARRRARVYRVDAAGKRYERPLLVSVTSRADWATRFAYPIGSSLGALFTRFRKYDTSQCSPIASQRGFYVYTPGHRSVLHSHTVTAERLPEGAQPIQGVRAEEDPLPGQPAFSFDGPKHRFTIRKKPRALNDTPYWIMSVPGSLIASHSDIFRVTTNRLIRALAIHTGTLVPDSTTVLVHETGMRPMGVVALPLGEVIFADLSRRVYAVPASSSKPIFIGCLPETVDPGAVIGAFHDEDSFFVISNIVSEKRAGEVEYHTEKVRLLLGKGGFGKAKAHRIPGSRRFIAATGDPAGNKLYLATSDEIYVADLVGGRSQLQPLVRIEGVTGPIQLEYGAAEERLLMIDTLGGRLYFVDLRADPPQMRLAAKGLGTPTDVDVDPITGEVYVADAKGHQIWRLECSDSGCDKAQVFAQSDTFVAPRVDVGPDRTVWVADPKGHKIVALDPDGTIRRTITSLAAEQE